MAGVHLTHGSLRLLQSHILTPSRHGCVERCRVPTSGSCFNVLGTEKAESMICVSLSIGLISDSRRQLQQCAVFFCHSLLKLRDIFHRLAFLLIFLQQDMLKLTRQITELAVFLQHLSKLIAREVSLANLIMRDNHEVALQLVVLAIDVLNILQCFISLSQCMCHRSSFFFCDAALLEQHRNRMSTVFGLRICNDHRCSRFMNLMKLNKRQGDLI